MARRQLLGGDACRAYPEGSLRGSSRRRTTCPKRIRVQPSSPATSRREPSPAPRSSPPATQMAASLVSEWLLRTGRAASTCLRRRTRRLCWVPGLQSSGHRCADLQEPRESASHSIFQESIERMSEHLAQGTPFLGKRSARASKPLVECVVAPLEHQERQVVRRRADGLDPPSTERGHPPTGFPSDDATDLQTASEVFDL